MDIEWPRTEESRGDGWFCAAETNANWRYLDAKLTFYLPTIADVGDDRLEEMVLHELAHVLVNEMRQEGREHEERVVTTLARAFIWVRDMTLEKPSTNGVAPPVEVPAEVQPDA